MSAVGVLATRVAIYSVVLPGRWYSALLIFRVHVCRKNPWKTPYRLPVRARYGISFMSSQPDWSFTLVTVLYTLPVYHNVPRYIESVQYYGIVLRTVMFTDIQHITWNMSCFVVAGYITWNMSCFAVSGYITWNMSCFVEAGYTTWSMSCFVEAGYITWSMSCFVEAGYITWNMSCFVMAGFIT